MRTVPSTIALFVCLLAPARAIAAPPVDPATRSSARQLGEEGNALFESGDWANALDKYQRAAALVNVPTLGLRIARCLEKLGRLVEASERYLAVTRLPLPEEASKVHEEAKLQAAAEREQLLPRIPSVVVTLQGPGEIQVSINGHPLAPALIGAKRAIDPGKHRVQARRGAEIQTREINVSEGESGAVAFEFGPEPAAPPVASGEPVPTVHQKAEAPAASGSSHRTFGFIGLGVGALGLAVGAGAGIMGMSKKSELESSCGQELECPPPSHDDAKSYNQLRTISTVGFVVGAIGGAAGLTLLLTAPKDPSPSARLGVFLEARRVGMIGAF